MGRLRKCSCGSGLQPFECKDARGIFLTFACDKCMAAKLRTFRTEVLNDPNYWHDEPIDDD